MTRRPGFTVWMSLAQCRWERTDWVSGSVTGLLNLNAHGPQSGYRQRSLQNHAVECKAGTTAQVGRVGQHARTGYGQGKNGCAAKLVTFHRRDTTWLTGEAATPTRTYASTSVWRTCSTSFIPPAAGRGGYRSGSYHGSTGIPDAA